MCVDYHDSRKPLCKFQTQVMAEQTWEQEGMHWMKHSPLHKPIKHVLRNGLHRCKFYTSLKSAAISWHWRYLFLGFSTLVRDGLLLFCMFNLCPVRSELRLAGVTLDHSLYTSVRLASLSHSWYRDIPLKRIHMCQGLNALMNSRICLVYYV